MEKFQMAISPQPVVRSTPCLFLEWGFPRRRIQWRYLQFEKIQDDGRRHLGKISNGHISATGPPIHVMFGYRVGFSGTADLMALFSIRTNSRWRPPPSPPSWIISNGHISATAHDLLYLYSTHRAVIFAIAQLSCLSLVCIHEYVQRAILIRPSVRLSVHGNPLSCKNGRTYRQNSFTIECSKIILVFSPLIVIIIPACRYLERSGFHDVLPLFSILSVFPR